MWLALPGFNLQSYATHKYTQEKRRRNGNRKKLTGTKMVVKNTTDGSTENSKAGDTIHKIHTTSYLSKGKDLKDVRNNKH